MLVGQVVVRQTSQIAAAKNVQSTARRSSSAFRKLKHTQISIGT